MHTFALQLAPVLATFGVMMLIEAWPELIAMYPAAYLVMVGSGKGSWDDCGSEIAEYVRRRELDAHVALVGHSDEVHEFMRAADLFVNPSDYEGFSLTLVEALGCAIPVVTTAVGVAPEVIRDGSNGYLCPPKDKRALTAAIARALAERHRWASIGELGRESVLVFDTAQIVERYLLLLGELHSSASGEVSVTSSN